MFKHLHSFVVKSVDILVLDLDLSDWSVRSETAWVYHLQRHHWLYCWNCLFHDFYDLCFSLVFKSFNLLLQKICFICELPNFIG